MRRRTVLPHELIVVDNGSTDGSVEMLEGLKGPSTRVLFLPENQGYAAGNNRAIEKATGEFLCLLNSDAFVTRGWLESLLRCAAATGAGMVGPCTDHAKGKQRYKPWLGCIPPPRRRTEQVDYLSFFCVLISRAVVEKIGLLDERFGIGTYEDDDFCRRARAAGFNLFIDGRGWVWHRSHATFDANRLDQRVLRRQNQAIYDEKWKNQSPSP